MHKSSRRQFLIRSASLGAAFATAGLSRRVLANPASKPIGIQLWSPMAVDADYLGNGRDASNPFPGPFESPVSGEVRVWPKR